MRALLSTYDKTGLVDFANGLASAGWELISSGGTAATLRDAGLDVTDVAEVTEAPEMLDGRVKTLHPAIHGGILADRSKPEHMDTLDQRGITPIDLVVCNLYPFHSEPGVELIDIGGPAMVRAAAKNFASVTVVTSPADYDAVLDEIASSRGVGVDLRRQLAAKAFAHTSEYDAAITNWLHGDDGEGQDDLPETLNLSLRRSKVLRYGENPHQTGALYRTGARSWWDSATQHNGKEMSYLNVFDADAAWRLVWSVAEPSTPAAVVVKHANPCGVGLGSSIGEAYGVAHACDSVSAFGGIVAVNTVLDESVAAPLSDVFTEIVIAPGYTDSALELLSAKKNLRILEAPQPSPAKLDVRSVGDAYLVQTSDTMIAEPTNWKTVTNRSPTDSEVADLELAWKVVAATTSNAIVLVKDGAAVGIGCGQQNRRDAGKIAAKKADGRAAGGACASDAFFPFTDGLDAAIDAGATAVVQPGGSVRDQEVIEAADEAGLAMVFTGERHFKH